MSGSLIDRFWYGQGKPLAVLAPLAWLYRTIAQSRRRKALRARHEALPVPVVVVGNITAGGTGKSPLTARLVQRMQQEGWSPVILSRGYGGKSDHYPLLVQDSTPASVCGDEPLMLTIATGCPVVVDPDRCRGAHWALQQKLGNVLICDDGLQHYRLPRDIELAVFDARRGIGNGALIPVGPLREPTSRLASVDFVILNGAEFPQPGQQIEEFANTEHPDIHAMTLQPSALVNLNSGEILAPHSLKGQSVRAVAGIGNPARYFDTLRALGARVQEAAFADHHRFRPEDLGSSAGEWLVMTAKDAVKCRGFAPDNAWVLTVDACLSEPFEQRFLQRLGECAGLSHQQNTERTHHG
ncbi:tetraacyldisaccharide 4'-kinase [Marinobacter halophilus]|uniref:Tetraacyldisaccharide 4'-kinase n=1 Tax=Marinobacter halophilus TaxID=1323740 RepID=A0A2T1KAI3_9GAMM|nr:tetraacyldisaccharide 4'-kinase [Marinobacter halophilus]PSF06562.1 tetraacyldisaccharide 4'-kinase [Marinobacter halophilus]GGC73651.1 tetraacyldisaccharide 4'-kinase [Marinobacter halophilus]